MCDSPHLRAGCTLKHGSGNLMELMSTLRQVPEALAQKMAEGLDFQKLTTTCTVFLAKCAGKYLHRHYCTWVKTTRLAVCHTVNIRIKVCLRFQH